MKRNILPRAGAAWLVLCAILLPAWDAFPGMVNIPVTMFDPANQTKPSISFEACAEDTTNTDTFTFNNHDVGTAAGNRHTIVGIIGNDNADAFNVTSVTVEGDSATEVAEGGGGSNTRKAIIYIIANPAGTAEDIVVTFSEEVVGAAICTWAAYGLASATAVDTGAGSMNDGSGDPLTMNTDMQAFGIAVGICGGNQTADPFAWTGLTEREDTSGADTSWSAADVTEDDTGSTPLSITCDGSGNADQAGLVASFR